jgi:hypothetical protein
VSKPTLIRRLPLCDVTQCSPEGIYISFGDTILPLSSIRLKQHVTSKCLYISIELQGLAPLKTVPSTNTAVRAKKSFIILSLMLRLRFFQL